MEYYVPTKINELVIYTMTWMSLEKPINSNKTINVAFDVLYFCIKLPE